MLYSPACWGLQMERFGLIRGLSRPEAWVCLNVGYRHTPKTCRQNQKTSTCLADVLYLPPNRRNLFLTQKSVRHLGATSTSDRQKSLHRVQLPNLQKHELGHSNDGCVDRPEKLENWLDTMIRGLAPKLYCPVNF